MIRIQLLAYLLCLCCHLHASVTTPSMLIPKMKSLVQSGQYAGVGILVRDNLGKTIQLSQLQKLAAELNSRPLIQAAQATRQFYSEKRALGIQPNEFLQTALFILTEMPEVIKKGNYYLTREITNLCNPIDYDPITRKTFIVLDGHEEAFLGLGGKKKVYKAILFDEYKPKVVARGEQFKPMDAELKMCKLLKGAPGIFATSAVTTHTVDGVTYTALYSDLYYPGSLTREVFKEYAFNTYEKAKIIFGVLTGLDSLHSQDLVHRDLHAQNYFINIEKLPSGEREVEAVVGDLGRTLPIHEAKGVVVQGSVKSVAPEGFFVEKMNGKDYFATDIFAAGCVFYRLYYGKEPEWVDKKYFKDVTVSPEEKSSFMILKLYEKTAKRRAHLERRKDSDRLSPKEQLEFLILQMVNINPAARGSAKFLKKEVESILQRLN